MTFRLQPAISQEQLALIDDMAYKILETVGMKVPSARLCDILAGCPGLSISGEIVKFARAAVREAVYGVQGCHDYDTHIVAGAYSHNYHDPHTNEIRTPTQSDLLTSIKQANALGLGVCAPVVPLDVPGPRQELLMERLTHEYAKYSYGGGQATHPVTAEASVRMSEVVGRPHGLELWINSPLTFDGNNLETLWNLRHLKTPVRVASMPVLGMSAPMNLKGIMAQSVAECWGAITLLKLLKFESEISFRIDAFVTYSADMRSGNVLINGPDYLRLLLLATEIARHNGVAVPAAKSILTGAKMPGTQSGAEKTAQSLAVAMAGADVYLGLGSLAIVETFSPIQMIIDLEIVRYVDAVMRPVNFAGDSAFDAIADVGPGGTFLDHPSTADNIREMIWDPVLFSQNSLSAWILGGKRGIEEQACDVLRELKISDGPVVSENVQKELQGIELRYSKMLDS
jgi:trimethylamine--corrinoid protein Co-methyltransferase